MTSDRGISLGLQRILASILQNFTGSLVLFGDEFVVAGLSNEESGI
jgi:hypothetical protein